MNVYDFDGTIYEGDSTIDFYLFALKRHPALVRYVPRQVAGTVRYALKKINKTQWKEVFYSFLRGIDSKALLADFWEQNRKKIFSWYLSQQQPQDIVISASPEFLLKPICDELGIRHLIASRVDPRTGSYTGENCRGQEKVLRLRQEFGQVQIQCFYSDSESDLPLAQMAEEAYLVKKGNAIPWEIH